MPPRQSRPPSTDHLLPPILSLLSPPSPNPYSAHQKALTTVARIQSQAPAVATEICFATSKELLKLGEGGSGVEIAVRGISILEGEGTDLDDKIRASITQLLALTSSNGPWRKKLADTAIKYSIHCGDSPSGDSTLHHYIGELYYKDHQYSLAESHLISSFKRDSASILAEMMYDWSGQGKNDPSPYAVRGVLPYLTFQPPSTFLAQTFLSKFLSLLSQPTSSSASLFLHITIPKSSSSSSATDTSSIDLPIQLTTSPTLNFLQLAISTVESAPAEGVSGVQARGTDGGIAREWEGLVGRYRRLSGNEGVLNNKEVEEALIAISTNVFLIPPPRGQQNDLIQNLMGSLFGGGR